MTLKLRDFFAFVLLLVFPVSAHAGGSISFEQVRTEIAAKSPKLIETASATFTINGTGGALRLGPHSAQAKIEGESVIGKRVPPYSFLCKAKTQSGDYDLVITFDQIDSGWSFTVQIGRAHV